MKRLTEWIDVSAETQRNLNRPPLDVHVDNMLDAWGGNAYAELSLVLVHLRYLGLLHQTHHWICKGDPFYSDHKMFEGFYNKIVEEVDDVGEKAVGMSNENSVNLQTQMAQLHKLVCSSSAPQTVPNSADIAKASLMAEVNFLKLLKVSLDRMRAEGTQDYGVENMLQEMFDVHERHIYLLKRRCSSAPMGF